VALLAVLLATSFAASASSSQASPGLGFVPCAEASAFSCATLAVPLDRSGATPGTVTLSVQRKLAGAQPGRSAVLALAGGPGQATLPLGEFIAKAIAPALGSRDLLLFDQRGTGASDPLSCAALEEPASSEAVALERCALDIGPARGDFTTLESVNDIEALRQAAGYEKLVLYGTSYGTKVALEYAERYPQHVEALVLDSVVPVDGEEPFHTASFQAIAPALAELCSAGACAGITSNATADVARLAAKLRTHDLRGVVYDGFGHRHLESLDELGLYNVLGAGDLNPALRALLPAAVQSALHGDPGPLLRLSRLALGLIPNVTSARGAAARAPRPLTASSDQVDEALFVTTICEETPFPWQRGASASTRVGEALTFLHAQASNAFYPFDTSTAFGASLIPACSRWPDASQTPPAPHALPAVPTLILSGAQDLRTPTAQAERVAALIPGAQVEVVPYTGHSVLGSDLSHCAERALATFFAGTALAPCSAGSDVFAPTPVTPTRLSSIHPPSGLGGRPGRTLVAALDTIVDLNRQIIGATIQANTSLPSGSSFGGLRGGYARLTSSAVILKRFEFVPGVELSGTFHVSSGRLQSGTLRIAGAQAAQGTLRLASPFKRVTGSLGGHSFSVLLAGVHVSRAGAREWPAGAQLAPLLARPRGLG
jgi:pimeloyl-ACP methyl ester carboxylesterase